MVARPRTVLHGIDQSVATVADLPNSRNMASECFLEDLFDKRIHEAAAKAWLPTEYLAFSYDPAVHGGSVAAHSTGVTVPAGTIILDGLLEVVNAFTYTAGATIAIRVVAANDVYSAANVSGIAAEGLYDVVPLGAAANMIRVTADSVITVTIGSAAVASGKLYGYLRCVRGHVSEEQSSSSLSSNTSSSSVSASSSSLSASSSSSLGTSGG